MAQYHDRLRRIGSDMKAVNEVFEKEIMWLRDRDRIAATVLEVIDEMREKKRSPAWGLTVRIAEATNERLKRITELEGVWTSLDKWAGGRSIYLRVYWSRPFRDQRHREGEYWALPSEWRIPLTGVPVDDLGDNPWAHIRENAAGQHRPWEAARAMHEREVYMRLLATKNALVTAVAAERAKAARLAGDERVDSMMGRQAEASLLLRKLLPQLFEEQSI